MNYVVPGQDGSGSGDGLKTKFKECNDTVTAKIEVNLRALPSVTNPDATVVATIKMGKPSPEPESMRSLAGHAWNIMDRHFIV